MVWRKKVSSAPQVNVTGKGINHSDSLVISRSVSIYIHDVIYRWQWLLTLNMSVRKMQL